MSPLGLDLAPTSKLGMITQEDRLELAWSRTFALSTGAVTNVDGIADMKPAAAYSATESSLVVRFGVTA